MQLRRNSTLEQYCTLCPKLDHQLAEFVIVHYAFTKPICRDCAMDFARGLAELLPTLRAGDGAGVEAVRALVDMARNRAGATGES